MNLLKDQRGQGGVSNLFIGLVIWAAFTVAWINIAAELLTNIVAPALELQQFGSTGILMMNIGAYLLWFLIPIVMIAAAFSGRQVSS